MHYQKTKTRSPRKNEMHFKIKLFMYRNMKFILNKFSTPHSWKVVATIRHPNQTEVSYSSLRYELRLSRASLSMKITKLILAVILVTPRSVSICLIELCNAAVLVKFVSCKQGRKWTLARMTIWSALRGYCTPAPYFWKDSKNKATHKCSKELKNNSSISVETLVVKLL